MEADLRSPVHPNPSRISSNRLYGSRIPRWPRALGFEVNPASKKRNEQRDFEEAANRIRESTFRAHVGCDTNVTATARERGHRSTFASPLFQSTTTAITSIIPPNRANPPSSWPTSSSLPLPSTNPPIPSLSESSLNTPRVSHFSPPPSLHRNCEFSSGMKRLSTDASLGFLNPLSLRGAFARASRSIGIPPGGAATPEHVWRRCTY